MRRAFLVLALLAPGAAHAAETQLQSSGYLLTAADAPVTGDVPMTFRIYDRLTPAGQVLIWSGSCTVAVAGGYYEQALGQGVCGTQSLDASVFAGTTALEVEVSGVTLAPRHALRPLAFATIAGDSAKLGGLAPAAFWQKSEALDGASLAAGSVPASALAGGITSGQLATGLDGAKLSDGTVAPAALSGPLPLSGVQFLPSIVATCPVGQALRGYDTQLNPVCASVASGSGTGTILQWDAVSLDFGTVTSTASTLAVTLLNVGGAAASGVVVTAPAGFAANAAPGCATLAAGASCSVTFNLTTGAGTPRTGVASAKGTATGAAPLSLSGTLYVAPNGESSATAGFSCSTILAAYPGSLDKAYWLDPDGIGTGNAAYESYCDMTNGGWTLVASTKYALSEPSWSASTTPYADLKSPRPTAVTQRVLNAIPSANLTDFRFSCYPSAGSNALGLDWTFPLVAGDNRTHLLDLYADGLMNTAANGKITQDNGRLRLIGYDGPAHADWGLGSEESDSAWWSHEAWGQVDSGGGHCQDPGVGSGTTPLGGTGQFHIWVKTGVVPASTGDGLSAANAATSCKALKLANNAIADGTYWLDPDGSGPNGAYKALCDMQNGGWTLIASTRIPSSPEVVWNVGASYGDLQTTKPTNAYYRLVNRIPIAQIGAFRFTCYTSPAATTYGVDWTFNLATGNNGSLLSDIYADGNIATYANGQLTQSTGTTRLIGYDNGATRADWGLGSLGTDSVYWTHEAWGQVDQSGGHCQEVGVGSGTTPLGGTGLFHIWVK